MLKKTKISNNFYLEEMMVSRKFPEFVFNPTKFIIDAIILFVLKVLQPLRDSLGVVITITSGWRPRELNLITDGAVDNSVHQILLDGKFLGVACDITTRNAEHLKLACKIALHSLPVKNIIFYPDRKFVHLDTRIDCRDKKLYISTAKGSYTEVKVDAAFDWSKLGE